MTISENTGVSYNPNGGAPGGAAGGGLGGTYPNPTVVTASITGGTINGTPIGATTPSTVAATTITATGNVNVQGSLNSTANISPASPTNSGVSLGGGPTYAAVTLFDQTQTASNRTADLVLLSGATSLRFKNDAGNAATAWLSATGGYASGITGITSNSGSGAWAHTGNMTVSGTLSVGGAPVARVVATDGKVAQAANVNAPSVYAVTTSGMYRVSTFIVVSQAATTSSTMPSVSVTYTEATTGIVVADQSSLTSTGNTLGLHTGGSVVIQAQAGSNIGYTTGSYASSGATPMQYAINVKVEALQ